MLTRRTVIASSAATAAWAAMSRWGIDPAYADGPLVRYNVASPEGKAMLTTYAKGVKALRAASTQLPKSWLFQAYIHASPLSKTAEIRRVYGTKTSANRTLAQAVWYTCQAHVSPPENEAYFLPWHRLYLGYFEAIIRAVTNTPSFTLPYWDYTAPGSASLPEEFQAKFAHHPVFGSLYMPNRNRNSASQGYANVNGGEPLNKYMTGSDNFLNLNDMTSRSYSGDTGFNQRIDNNLHGSIHVFVGDQTNMGNIPTAAADPVFWLHHCNIDRIWYAWTSAGGRNPTDAAWLDKTFSFAGADGKTASASVRSVADTASLPYKYDALPTAPGARTPQIALAPRTAAPDGAAPPQAAPPPAPTATQVAEGQTTAKATAPITLGAKPKAVTLTPVAPEFRLHSLAAGGLADTNQRFFLTLRGVLAQAQPGVTYKVYIDLPADAPADVASTHFVGLLNFFDKVAMKGMGMQAHMAGGKSVAFDITEVVKTLHLGNALADDTTVTLIPNGTPNPKAIPVIKDGIQITRE